MIGADIAARGCAFAATMLLFGVSLFLVYVPRVSLRPIGPSPADESSGLLRAVRRMQLVCLSVAIIASAAWLVLHAAVIDGEPVVAAASRVRLIAVAQETLFGRVAMLRLGLMLFLGAVVAWGMRARHASNRASDVVNAMLAAAALAAMAWMGHAVATLGPGGRLHLAADVVHLLAAGAWVGGLPPLALTLGRAAGSLTSSVEIAAVTTNRFSRLGILCVAALLVTGTVNAWFLVQRPAAFVDTPYGQLLLLKLALFFVMLGLAGVNRGLLMPRIVTTARHEDAARRNAAIRRVAHNAKLEITLGIAIALIVGALGVMVPAAHTRMAEPNLPASDAHRH